MSDRQPLVAGNWKLNGSRSSCESLACALIKGASGLECELAVCPAAVHLADVLAIVGDSPIHLGAQNCAEHDSGAFTGEVSAAMLVEFGCDYVIVGHSERRALYGETDSVVAHKAALVRAAGLMPIVCVGETLEQREAGQVEAVIGAQIDAVLANGGIAGFAQSVVAYEPVWAIGTGLTASPEQAQAVHAMIRARLQAQDAGIAARVRILYGGSVKPDNAAELFSQPDIDGGLVGGAALQAESFLEIARAAA